MKRLAAVNLIVGAFCLVGGSLSAQSWTGGQFKAGQYFKFTVNSERGLSGWVSLRFAPAAGANLELLVEAEWMGAFSEKLLLKPGMTSFDLVYSATNPSVPNLLASLLVLDKALLENTQLKTGFSWKQGKSGIVVESMKTVAGLAGYLVVYETVHAFTGRARQVQVALKPGFPVPLFVKCPAANDTWTYQLETSR